MHIINFLLALSIPYFSLLHRIGPTGVVPDYFFSNEAAYLSSLGGSLSFYWFGYLRSKVDDGKWRETTYFFVFGSFLVFVFASKIILTLPYSWVNIMIGYCLGWLSITYGQRYGKTSTTILIIASIYFIGLSAYTLTKMAWFGATGGDYYEYKDNITNFIIFIYTFIKINVLAILG